MKVTYLIIRDLDTGQTYVVTWSHNPFLMPANDRPHAYWQQVMDRLLHWAVRKGWLTATNSEMTAVTKTLDLAEVA